MKEKLSIVLALLLAGCSTASRPASSAASSSVQETVAVETAMSADEDAPIVYFTSDISAGGLMHVYEALGWEPSGNVAVKVSTGESERSILANVFVC